MSAQDKSNTVSVRMLSTRSEYREAYLRALDENETLKAQQEQDALVLRAVVEERNALKAEVDTADQRIRALKMEVSDLRRDICSALRAYENEGPRLAALRVMEEKQKAEAALAEQGNRPKIVCFCGSIRFSAEMMIWAWECAKRGIIVLTWHVLPDGYFKGTDDQNCVHGAEVEGVREIVDELHKRKIDLADAVYVVNVGGYIGDSTKSEVAYALNHGKPLVWLEPDNAEANLEAALAYRAAMEAKGEKA